MSLLPASPYGGLSQPDTHTHNTQIPPSSVLAQAKRKKSLKSNLATTHTLTSPSGLWLFALHKSAFPAQTRILGRRRRLSLRGGIRQEKGEEGIEVPTGGGRNGGADNAEINL